MDITKKVKQYRGYSALFFKNVRKDFESPYIFRGMTKSGNIHLREIVGEGPQGLTFGRHQIAKKSGKAYWLRRDGFYLDEE